MHGHLLDERQFAVLDDRIDIVDIDARVAIGEDDAPSLLEGSSFTKLDAKQESLAVSARESIHDARDHALLAQVTVMRFRVHMLDERIFAETMLLHLFARRSTQ